MSTIVTTPAALFARDLGVGIYTSMILAEILLLVRNLRALISTRKPIYGLSSAMCLFSMCGALNALVFTTQTSVIGQCYLRAPISGLIHMLSELIGEGLMLYKVSLVNQGTERRIFVAIGSVLYAGRLASHIGYIVVNGSAINASGACVTILIPVANWILNVGITFYNAVLGFMVIYPLSRHVKSMGQVAAGSNSPINNKLQGVIDNGLKYGIMQCCSTVVVYACITANVAGTSTFSLIYIDWTIMTFCVTGLLLEPLKARNRRISHPAIETKDITPVVNGCAKGGIKSDTPLV